MLGRFAVDLDPWGALICVFIFLIFFGYLPTSTGLLVEAAGLGRPGSGLVLARGRALRSTACRCEAAMSCPGRPPPV